MCQVKMSISSVDSGPLHVKPEIDLNLAAEANRISHVLHQVIARAKIVGLLKLFIKNDAEVLKDIVDPDTQFNVFQACQRYLYDLSRRSSSIHSSQDGSIAARTQRSSAQSSASSRLIDRSDSDNSESVVSKTDKVSNRARMRNDNAITEIMYLLERNPEVVKLAEELTYELSPQMKSFIHHLIEFKNRMLLRLNENATQYKTRERYMRETFAKNEQAKEEIERLEEELLVTKTDANVCLIGRHILIKRHQNKIERIQQNSREIIEKKVNESEKAMVSNWKSSVIAQENLRQDLLQASDKYANLLKEHLAVEKVLRAKRTKVENQVLGWIQKFDQDIGEKQAEEEEVQALLDQETNELNEIQSKIDEQEEEYDELMQEKAEYEEEMLERRLYQFVVNRSARRIQRTYRLYKARKLAKKLAKKGKKGKKKG